MEIVFFIIYGLVVGFISGTFLLWIILTIIDSIKKESNDSKK